MDKQQADLRVRELGERMGLPELSLDHNNMATLAVEDGPRVMLGYAPASGMLELMICLDAIEVTPSIMNDVLAANFAWLHTGGGAFAIDAASQALVLQRRCSDADTANGGLLPALEALVAAAEAWRLRFVTGEGTPSPKQDTATMAIPTSMVRA